MARRWLALAMLAAVFASAAAGNRLERHEFTQVQMGMPFKLVLYAPDEASANAAAKAAFARIKQLNGIMSDYEPESELMQLCRAAGQGKAIPASRDLIRVIARAQTLSESSGGAFDITVGPMVRLWRKARRTREMPAPDQLAAARRLVDFRNIRLDQEAGSIELKVPGMQLDLGGIAVGYAIDEALQLLKERGIESALLDGSGDIGVSGAPPGTDGWRIGVAPLEPDAEPSRYLVLKHAAVTTSGDAWQFVEIDGKRYSHIVDPSTGLGLADRMSVTIVARDCTAADSYATAVCVLGIERGLKLVEQTPGMASVVVRLSEGKAETQVSLRMNEYEERKP